MAVLSLACRFLRHILNILKHPDFHALLLLIALPLAFLAPALFGGKVLLPIDILYSLPPWSAFAFSQGVGVPHNHLIADMILQNYAWKSFAKQSYAAGQFPLWNPNIFCGMPFLAGGQYAALYPLGFIFHLLPVAYAYGWFTALHLFLGGAFTYLFARVMGLSRLGGLISGVTFMFSAFLVVSFLWPMILSAAIWLPFILTMIELVVRQVEREGSGESTKTSTTLLWVLLGGIGLGLQLLAGHLEISLYVLFSAMLFAVFRLAQLWFRDRRIAGVLRMVKTGTLLVVMVAIGFGLAAAQLAPFFEIIRENFRAGYNSYDEVVGWALPAKRLATFLVPDLFGNPARHSFLDLADWSAKNISVTASDGSLRSFVEPAPGVYKNYVEGAAYVGLVPLLLAPLALLSRRHRYVWFFVGFAVLSLLLAFGTPLYRLLWLVPGVNQLHTPFRWIFPYSFCLSILAGLGFHAVTEKVRKPTLLDSGRGTLRNGAPVLSVPDSKVPLSLAAKGARGLGRLPNPILAPRRALAGLGLLAAFAGLGVLVTLAASRLLLDDTLSLADRLLGRSPTLKDAFGSGVLLYSYEARNLAVFGLILLAAGLLFLYWRKTAGDRRFGVAVLALLVVDLFVFGYGFNTMSDARLLDFTPPSISKIQEDPEVFRITTFNYDDVLKPDAGMIFGLQDIRGYDTIIMKQYVEFWKLLEEPQGLTSSMIHKLVDAKSLESPLLDLMNVKYVLTTQNIGLPHYTEVYRGEINVYRNDDVLPRAFAVFREQRVDSKDKALAVLGSPDFDPHTTVVLEGAGDKPTLPPSTGQALPARIESYRDNEVKVAVTMPRDGYLVLTDSFFPGWRAYDNGSEVPLLRADRIFRAVRLGAGDHLVTFHYSPLSFQAGLYGSFIASVAILLAFALWLWRRFSREVETTSAVRSILKNSAAPTAAQLVTKAIDFGFAILYIRLLGSVGVGEYTFAIGVWWYFSIVTGFGLGQLVMRDVARERHLGPQYLSNTVILRLALTVLSYPVVLGIVGAYLRFDQSFTANSALAIALLVLGLIPGNVADSFAAICYAHEHMEYPAAVSVVTALLRVTFSSVALFAGWGVVGLAAVSVVVNTMTMVILWQVVRDTFFAPRFSLDLSLIRRMITESFPFMINNFLATAFFRIDVLLLQPMKGPQVLGWYGTAYKFIDGLNIIPSNFTLAIFPIICRFAYSEKEAMTRAFRLSLKALLIVAMPLTVGITLLSEQIIALFAGPEFLPYSAIALSILIGFLPFSFINSVTQYVLIAINKQRFLTIAFLIGVVFNLAANMALIPRMSYAGAALTTILSEVVLLVPFMYAARGYLRVWDLVGLAWRPTLAALIMGLVVLLLRQQRIVLVVPLGAVTYFALLVILRTFEKEEIAIVGALRRA